MKDLLIIGFVIITIIYIVGQHLFNWLFRKTHDSIDTIIVPIGFGYLIFNGLYWLFAVNIFKVIL